MKPISRTVSLKFPNVEKRQLMHAEYSSARVIHRACERDRTLSEFQGCTDDTDTYIGTQLVSWSLTSLFHWHPDTQAKEHQVLQYTQKKQNRLLPYNLT